MPSSLATNRMANTPLHTGSPTTTTTTLDSSIPTAIRSPQRRGPVPIGTLRLRAASAPRRGIRWAEDVVDNEGMGRKSSKVCCIYHKPHPVGESSDESSSDDSSSSDSDSDGEVDGAAARKRESRNDGAGGAKPHQHAEGCEHAKERGKKSGKRSGNAYEKMKTKGPKGGGGGGGVVGTQTEK
ncbi:hypothetical protein MMC15_000452 [Xylographa vitiligo]|nr:hypothetical protein [Xylographa vitiligo]